MNTAIAITGTGSTTASGLDAALDALPPPVRARALRVEAISQLVLAAAGAALADADLASADAPPRLDVGVVLGTGVGCFLTNATFQRRFASGGVAAASPRLFAATVSNAAAGELGIAWRLGGPTVTLSAGAASGLAAIGHAAALLDAGEAVAMVAGGMDAAGTALDTWLADGGLPGGIEIAGAAGVLVLETMEAASARGRRVLGTITGHATGFSARGVVATIGRALAAADVVPRDVALVVSGGGTLPADVLGSLGLPEMSTHDAANTFAAAGPLGVMAALAKAPIDAPVLVVGCCPSGHVAALVVRRGGAS
ncbi:MAG TPA: beta-ketoacyl synthase N-terminal-like domain-containing protein [Candidatus Binatia bacterium]|jgi:3-oxoacyl-(acyl-carrier-protein) synthase|nr:beta-ketoacyl synthase N-terminal-like domain-containing protein [Candidatus Binatia bacterium]